MAARFIYLGSCIYFMLAIAYTLNKNGHVRIDIFYRKLNKLKKKIDFFGSFFWITFCYFLIFDGYDYFVRSFLITKIQKKLVVCQILFILKFFIFLMGILLFFEIVNKIYNIRFKLMIDLINQEFFCFSYYFYF